jgi:hypothetical protein
MCEETAEKRTPVLCRGSRLKLLARLAGPAISHGFYRTRVLFRFGEDALAGPFGCAQGRGRMGATHVTGVLAAVLAFFDGAADFLLHRDRRLLDVRGAEAAEVVGRLEAHVPGLAVLSAPRCSFGFGVLSLEFHGQKSPVALPGLSIRLIGTLRRCHHSSSLQWNTRFSPLPNTHVYLARATRLHLRSFVHRRRPL